MDYERTLFDPVKSEEAKQQGMDLAASRRSVALGKAREIAVELANRYGTVTADDVFRVMLERGLDPTSLGPAAGSIFRQDFFFTGEWVKSNRVSNHARMNRVWALVD